MMYLLTVFYFLTGFVCYLALRNLRHWSDYHKAEVTEVFTEIYRLIIGKPILGDIKLRYVALYLAALLLSASCFFFFMSFLASILDGSVITFAQMLGHLTSGAGIMVLWYAVFKKVGKL
jgi:hypothetical protein